MGGWGARGLGIARGPLVTAFAAMFGVFALTTFLARWHDAERQRRAERYFQIGETLASRGKEEEAIEEFRNALSIARGNREYRLAVAETLLRLGRFSEAEVYLEELLAADPANAIPNLLLARIAARQGRTQAAIDDYHRAIYGYWPEAGERRRMETRWELVRFLAAAGATKPVIAQLLEIADQAPNDPATKRRVAAMLLKYGPANQAAEIYRDVVRQNPRDAEAEAGYGRAELAAGNDAAAQAAFRRALRLNPRDEETRRELEITDRALELDPTLRGLHSADRYLRSRRLIAAAADTLEECGADPAGLQSARKALTAHARPARLGDAAEQNIAVAEQLWSARPQGCADRDPALARVLARIER